jgi:very-short-patch-repair endonuclease
MTKNIITGQKVTAEKSQRAKELRQKMTPAEQRLWQQLRANRLDGWHFRRQQIIEGFIVDFYCHRAGLVIEVDGPIHDRQQAADTEREAIIRANGLKVLRFTNRQVMNEMQMVLNKIRQTLALNSPPRAGGG